MMRLFFHLILITTALIATSPALAAARQHLIPGGLAIIDLPAGFTGEARFNNQPLMILPETPSQPRRALAGIPLSQTPGTATIQLGQQRIAISIAAYPYPEQRLTVQKQHVNPSAGQLARVRREQAMMDKVYTSFSTARPWQGMIWPVRGRESSAFGLRRFFNGEERNPHSGLDVAMPTGTPVVAPAPGKVVLTGDFFFNGNSVFIDHGQGLITMVCHLHNIGVTEGTEVQAGDQIGTIGATGRATGPHLHWTVSLNNARIDPRLLLADDQPQSPETDAGVQP